MRASARETVIPDGFKVYRCTLYLPTGNDTVSGTVPYEGIIASSPDHLGEAAVIYDMDLRIIGIFECLDTGSHPGLNNGTRIDVYRENKQRIREWQKTYGDYVIVQWVKGKDE